MKKKFSEKCYLLTFHVLFHGIQFVVARIQMEVEKIVLETVVIHNYRVMEQFDMDLEEVGIVENVELALVVVTVYAEVWLLVQVLA